MRTKTNPRITDQIVAGQMSIYDVLGEPSDQDAEFLKIASGQFAVCSMDPSTKTGCVLVRNGNIIEGGYNRFPLPLVPTYERLTDRPTRLAYTVHAEVDALLAAGADKTFGATLYVVPWPPCYECAKLAIHAGIVRVVAPHPSKEQVVRWGNSFKLAEEMYAEAGVTFDLIDIKEV